MNGPRRFLTTAALAGATMLVPLLTRPGGAAEKPTAALDPRRLRKFVDELPRPARLSGPALDIPMTEVRQRRCTASSRRPRCGAESGKSSAVAFHIGKWSMHPVYGLPILAVVLYAVYQFVGVLGAGGAVDFLEETVFGTYLIPWAKKIVQFIAPVPLIQELLVGEYGLITMALTYSIAIVLPIVGFSFIAFSLLEDSGYLPRLAVMVKRIFKVMGLNGKAVLPMILGLGCDTMATLTTRILETRKARILVTLLLALAVPC